MNGHSHSKGKAKQHSKNGDAELMDEAAPPSMASRVASSASRLAQNIISNPRQDLPTAIASSSMLGNKAHGSNSSLGTSSWVENLHDRSAGAFSRNSEATENNRRGDFRSTRLNPPRADELVEFQSTSRYGGYRTDVSYELSGHWAEQFHSNRPTVPNKDSLLDMKQLELYAGSHLPDIDDGAEVRAVLCDSKSFASTEEDEMLQMQDHSDENVADLFQHNFSPEEKNIEQSIRSTLPMAPVHKAMPADHPLNLRPSHSNLRKGLEDLSLSSASVSPASVTYLADSDKRDRWLSEWDEVLKSYADDVWGDLLPEVKDAKLKLEQVRTGKGTLDGKAVARLKMILDHIRPPKQSSAVGILDAAWTRSPSKDH